MKIELRDVSKSYDKENTTVSGLDINVGDGELVTILGPSGCGKSTTLLMIAGIHTVSGGGIYFDGKLMNGVQPKNRELGMVFQHAALYPNMNVQDNIAFPLKNKGVPRKKRLLLAAEAAKQVQMEDYLKRKPSQLSGGQQQRVAIARAIVKKPELLLLDEPLSSLDANLRISMREEIRKLQRELGVTTVMVTHDQEEALSMSDKIAILKDGKLQQFGTPEELYNYPANWFVARFLGMPTMNELECRWEVVGKSLRIAENDLVIELPYRLAGDNLGSQGQRLCWAFRPHQVELFKSKPEKLGHSLSGKVVFTEFTGRERLIHLSVGSTVVKAVTDVAIDVHEGQEIWFQVEGNIFLFDYDTGESIYSNRVAQVQPGNDVISIAK